jgi:hypothetical protein
MSNSADSESKEARVLRAMKRTLTGVIRDTTTAPGHRHPLSDETIEDIRQCLMLISARERELAEEGGGSQTMRPYYSDEPKKSVAVPVGEIGKAKKGGDNNK